MFKKIILIIVILLLSIGCYLFFPKKLTLENIETKISQTTEIISEIKETIAPEPTKISQETGLPNKHLIETVFIQQAPEKNWDDPWQESCEEASLLTIDYFYQNIESITIEQNRDDILNMIEFETSQNLPDDINVFQMSLVAQEYLGYQTEIIDNPTIDEIKKYLSQDIPIIVPAAGKILYEENKHFNSGGPYYHNIVILGYDDNTQKFTVHDVGTKAGAYFKYSYSLLMESIHDFPVSGNKEDILIGEKKVLVLLK